MNVKHCNGCDQDLPLSSFYKRGPNGLQAKCKTCQNEGRKKYVKPHEVSRRRHGFTDEEYTEIMAKAVDGCEVCGRDMGSKICFDHDHESGKFRGLLCHNCNTMLGLAKDNVHTLEKAILYLKK